MIHVSIQIQFVSPLPYNTPTTLSFSSHLHLLLAMYDYPISNLLLSQHLDSFATPAAGIFASPPPPQPPPPFQDHLATNAFDSVRKALATLKSEVANNNFLPPPLPSYLLRPTVIQRSVSSHSLQKDVYHPLASPREEEAMRKVFSTGDLQVLLLFFDQLHAYDCSMSECHVMSYRLKI